MIRDLFLPFLCTAALLTGCGGSSSNNDTGELSLVLTDAAHDEVEVFEVDVTDIIFTKLNGSTVSLLSRATRVDFASLRSLSELVVGAGLEIGFYTSVQMTLDFTNATVCLAGQTTPATVLDEDGNPITGTVPVQVVFSAGSRPQIAAARHHLYVLDLDLDQAMTVDVPGNQVTFSPVISASIDPSNPKPVAVTGILTAIDALASRFTLERRALDGNPIGAFTVQTGASTVFQVDGVVTQGVAGMAALATQTLGTSRVFVQGVFTANNSMLNAVAVESGAGTPGNGQDWVHGHIVARDNGAGNDATLTVMGSSVDVSSNTRVFNTLHTVTVEFANTRVLRRAAGNSLDSDALNVGQRIMAFGTLAGTSLNANGSANGVVRMLRTNIFGVASGAPVNDSVTVNMVRFGLRNIGSFNFMVGGVPESVPGSYTVDVTGLSTTGIVNGSKLHMIGWVNGVGNVADDNATALSVVNRSTNGRLLLCQWSPPSVTALLSISTVELALDVSAAALKAVGDGFGPVALTNSPTPTIRPLTVLGIYRIVEDQGVELHLGWDSFQASLAARVSLTSPVFRIAALGTYDQTTQAFSALVVTVVLD